MLEVVLGFFMDLIALFKNLFSAFSGDNEGTEE
jgi:hypothetical protein